MGDEQITVEAGSAETEDLLAVYRDADGRPRAVLGMNQPRQFMRIRKTLNSQRHPSAADEELT